MDNEQQSVEPEVTEAVVFEPVVEETQAETEQPVEQSEDDKLGDLYDKAMKGHEPTERLRGQDGKFVSDKPAEAEPETDEQGDAEDGEAVPETDEDEAEQEPEASEAPGHLPQEVRQHWNEIPAEARDAIARSQSEMSSKLADAGRQMQGIAPIRDGLMSMAQEFPELMNMTPEAIMADTRELATTRVQLMRDPVNTLLSVARQLGALPKMQEALQYATPESLMSQAPMQGQQQAFQPQPQPQQAQPLQNQQQPANVEAIVQDALDQRDVQEALASFPEGKQHWATVEPHMPRFVEAAWAIKGEGASYRAVLDTAYNMATAELGLMADKQASPAKAAPKTSPKRTEAVIRAKSVNVSSRAGNSKPKSEMDALSEAYDRMMTG